MALLEIQNLSFKYALSDKKCLDGINLEIDEGDFVVVFGTSGSGKTTLLRHMKRELVPVGDVSGSVLFRGRDIREPENRMTAGEIGFVTQNPESQIVTEFVWHELAFGLENLNEDTFAIRRRVAEMASFFGIGSWFHKRTEELSGGQKQILNLASVLVMQPKVLLLDEPTSQLDPMAARGFLEMLSRLNRELGITIIMTGHRLEEILPIANRVVMMDKGHIKYDTEPYELPKLLIDDGNTAAFESLPSAARIFAGVSGKEPCPLTVGEARRKLLNMEIKVRAKTFFAAQEEKTDDCGGYAIQCHNIFFSYGKNLPNILNGLSFSAHYGEFVCLMGENGSGKSTLLRIVAGLLTPQIGKTMIGGKAIKSYSPRKLYFNNIGFLPQNPKAIFLHDTVLANISDLSMAEKFGLADLLDRHPYDLSGGEQQKAALVRVLEQKPKILLLDEPTKGLDMQAKEELANILLALLKDGVCIVASTHDIEFAAKYADKCLLLFDGIIASEGSPRKFFGGNSFYTTAANRIARDICPDAITCEDVRMLCGF